MAARAASTLSQARVKMAQYNHKHGGVGAPVDPTVFKTAGRSLCAVSDGFDSHTRLPTLPADRYARMSNSFLYYPPKQNGQVFDACFSLSLSHKTGGICPKLLHLAALLCLSRLSGQRE